MTQSTALRAMAFVAMLLVAFGLANGVWADPSVTNGEYRIDGGTAQPFQLGAPIIIVNPNPPPPRASEERDATAGPVSSTHLTTGLHFLEVGFDTNGGIQGPWQQKSTFYVTGPQWIKAAEYFIDVDPGEGHGMPIQAADGNWDQPEERVVLKNIPTTGLSDGMHTLYVRTKDQDEVWSKAKPLVPFAVRFEVAAPPHMVYAEWVTDSTVALGSGHAMDPADGLWDEEVERVVWNGQEAPGLFGDCKHYDICIRCKDSIGRWSCWWMRWAGEPNPDWPTDCPNECVPFNRLPAPPMPPPGDIVIDYNVPATFSAMDTDPDCDALELTWTKDTRIVSADPEYVWTPTLAEVDKRQHDLTLKVFDGVDTKVYAWRVAVCGPPKADFVADQTYGSAPFRVQFTDSSTGVPATWAWTFGDGGTDTRQNPDHTYTAPGTYTVTLTAQNKFGTSPVATKTAYIQVVSFDARADRSFWYYKYASPGHIDVTVKILNAGTSPVTGLGLQETIPAEWSFVSLTPVVPPLPNPPSVVPSPGATGTLEFRWTTTPAFPVTLKYRLAVPEAQVGEKAFSGRVLWTISSKELQTNVGPLTTIAQRIYHTADYNHDLKIGLNELLRVIQFYNSNGYHVQTATVDGYAPGPGSHDGPPHDSDYKPQDWKIGLSELLRVIQFYNAGGYHVQEGTEDGYAPNTKGGKAAAAKAAVSALNADRQIEVNKDGTANVAVTLTAAGGDPVTALSLVENLPAGWKFKRLVSGTAPFICPKAGASGTLEFAWVAVPRLPARFVYQVQAPQRASLGNALKGEAVYRTSGGELHSKVSAGTATASSASIEPVQVSAHFLDLWREILAMCLNRK